MEKRNLERAFDERQDVYAAWVQLNTAIKAQMESVATSSRHSLPRAGLRSSYCCLAHGTILRDEFDEPVREIALDHRNGRRSTRSMSP